MTILIPDYGNLATRRTPVRQPRDATQELLDAWRRGRTNARLNTSREVLLADARRRLIALVKTTGVDDSGAPTVGPAAFIHGYVLLEDLVVDDAPPTITSDGEGGVDISWLIDGTSVHVQVDSEVDVLIWATSEDGGVLFEAQAQPSAVPDAALDRVRRLVKDLLSHR